MPVQPEAWGGEVQVQCKASLGWRGAVCSASHLAGEVQYAMPDTSLQCSFVHCISYRGVCHASIYGRQFQKQLRYVHSIDSINFCLKRRQVPFHLLHFFQDSVTLGPWTLLVYPLPVHLDVVVGAVDVGPDVLDLLAGGHWR